MGYEFASWTVGWLKAHLDRVTSKFLSSNRLRVLLRELGYRYRQPKYELTHLKDGKFKEKAEELLEELKKSAWRRRRASLCDETTLTLELPLRACWMKVGQQKRIPAAAATIAWKAVPWKNSEFFIAFLEFLLATIYPQGRIILVLDSVAYHHSADFFRESRWTVEAIRKPRQRWMHQEDARNRSAIRHRVGYPNWGR